MATIKTSSGRKRVPKKSAPKQKVRIIYRDRECDKEHGSGGDFSIISIPFKVSVKSCAGTHVIITGGMQYLDCFVVEFNGRKKSLQELYSSNYHDDFSSLDGEFIYYVAGNSFIKTNMKLTLAE